LSDDELRSALEFEVFRRRVLPFPGATQCFCGCANELTVAVRYSDGSIRGLCAKCRKPWPTSGELEAGDPSVQDRLARGAAR
jgi:hypothetical protein